MHLASSWTNVVLHILWERPSDEGMQLANTFEAMTDECRLPGFEKDFSIVGCDFLGAQRTTFVLPDGREFYTAGGSIADLFNLVSQSKSVTMLGDDTMHAWVLVDGQAMLRGKHAVEEWGAHFRGDQKYSDDPDLVLVASKVRFLTYRQVREITTHLAEQARH